LINLINKILTDLFFSVISLSMPDYHGIMQRSLLDKFL